MKADLTRHKIRQLALQGLFSREFNPELTTSQILTSLTEFENKLINTDQDSNFKENVPSYLSELILGVLRSLREIDQLIESNLSSSWNLNRVAKIDLIILRIATFELKYANSVPPKVAINEAVELAKTFNDDLGAKFVNGILANIVE